MVELVFLKKHERESMASVVQILIYLQTHELFAIYFSSAWSNPLIIVFMKNKL
jgi:hypothetical protein